MAASYWMKFYYEILDDPKMGRMSDHHWRRVAEFFLIAGESGNGGYLPPVEDISWRLRSTPDEILETLKAIAKVGIVTKLQDGWFVTNFAKRNEPASNAERQRAYREKLRNRNDESNDRVTERDTDIDIDIDKDIDKDAPDNDIPETSYKPLEVAFCKATGQHPKIGGGQPTQKWVAAFLDMKKAGATPDDIEQACLEMVEKNYTIANPSSIINWVIGIVTKRNVKKSGKTSDAMGFVPSEYIT